MTDLASAWDEQSDSPSDFTKNDRFSEVLVAAVAALSVALGLLLHQRTLVQSWPYSNTQAGIEASYPAGWLTDERGDYVVRITNPRARPFKTRYVVSTRPAGGETSIRNVLDSLNLQRSIDLAAYRVLSVEDLDSGGQTYTRMSFAFVETDPNPFIERLPVVVLGTDMVFFDGNRAIIATFMADRESYEAELEGFVRFVASLQY